MQIKAYWKGDCEQLPAECLQLTKKDQQATVTQNTDKMDEKKNNQNIVVIATVCCLQRD